MSSAYRQKILYAGMKLSKPVSGPIAAQMAAQLFITPTKYKPRPEEAFTLSQATSWITNDGVQCYGWGVSGPVVMLVHGWSGAAAQMTHFVAPLLDRGYRVIALDGPAHGSSKGNKAHLPMYAKVISEIAQTHGPIHALIGHSLGATAITRAIAVHELSANRMVLIAGPSDIVAVFQRFMDSLELSDEALEVFTKELERETGMPREEVVMANWRLSGEALVVHDVGDKEVPVTDAELFTKLYRHSEFIHTSGLGHRRILRDSILIEKISAFISKDQTV